MENKKDIELLNTNLLAVSDQLQRINSYKFVFIRGVVTGVGTFVGATIVAAIVVTFAVQILQAFGWDGFLETFFQNR